MLSMRRCSLPHSLKLLSVSLAVGVLSSAAQASSEIELGLSDHTIEVQYSADINERAQANAQWIHHEDNGNFGAVGFYGKGENKPISGTLGAKLFTLDFDDNNPNDNHDNDGEGQGLALGGKVKVDLIERVAVEADLHFAPSVTSFGDVDNMVMFGTRITGNIFQGTSVFLGYRNVKASMNHSNDKAKLHEGLFAGLRINF